MNQESTFAWNLSFICLLSAFKDLYRYEFAIELSDYLVNNSNICF